MRNFVLAMIVVFLVLCVPWFCVAQASDSMWDKTVAWMTTSNADRNEAAQYCDNEKILNNYSGVSYQACDRGLSYLEQRCRKSNYKRCVKGYLKRR